MLPKNYSSLLAAAVAVPGLVLAGLSLVHPHHLTPETAHAWWTLHVALLPIWPLLAGALWLLLRGVAGPLAWLARLAGYGFAVFYTGLDVLAGIAAGLQVETDGRFSATTERLFDVGGQLGLIGAGLFLGAALLTAAVLLPGGRPWALAGGAVLAVSGLSFLDSHIFVPRGTITMIGIALGCALLALSRRPDPSA